MAPPGKSGWKVNVQSQSKPHALQRASRPSLGEVEKARPRRGTGAPARCASHYAAILRLLRERAEDGLGVLGSELYSHPDLYGRSPRNRISELRKDGHLIEGKPYGASDWFYRLIRDNTGGKPQAESPDWYERATGQPRPQLDKDELPLFRGRQ